MCVRVSIKTPVVFHGETRMRAHMDICVCPCVPCEAGRPDSFCLLSQTDTKPVQMMSLEATFCLGRIDSVGCKIIELPFQNKHLSMLILLPTDVEDESTGLEKVRGRGACDVPGCGGRRTCGRGQAKEPQPLAVISEGFVVLSGPCSLALKAGDVFRLALLGCQEV